VRVEQLEYIQAVTRLGSLRRAAEALHVSQPALSETVRNLERELGVALLERRRTGATISDEGRELLPHIAGVLEAVDRLRRAADEQLQISRTVRIGTVNAATVPLLFPVVAEFHRRHPATQVEVVGTRHGDIHQALLEGRIDTGLVNYLSGDDLPPELEAVELLRGRPVVCLRPDHRLAEEDAIEVAELAGEPFVAMRPGYVMHRFLHRLFGGRLPEISCSTDGAEMGKLMVSEGLGLTVLPDYSVRDDPLERGGAITFRPLVGVDAEVLLMLLRRRSRSAPRALRDLHELFVAHAAALG
jgi:DNA-binding transcriptional LysR family regulator